MEVKNNIWKETFYVFRLRSILPYPEKLSVAYSNTNIQDTTLQLLKSHHSIFKKKKKCKYNCNYKVISKTLMLQIVFLN